MLHLSGARALAMSIVAGGLGWWINLDGAPTLAHYKGLSHDALISELTARYSGDLASNLAGGAFLVFLVVIAVDLLTGGLDRLWARLGGPPARQPGGATPPSGGVGPAA